jgi:predicted transcriptional regulator
MAFADVVQNLNNIDVSNKFKETHMVSERTLYSSISLLTRADCSCRDVFSCLYCLSPPEIHLLNILLKSNKQLTLETLASMVRRNKGTVFRALQKLVSLNLCNKAAKTREAGGYYHVYTAADIDIIENSTKQRIAEVQRALNRIRRNLREDMIKMTLAS